MPDLPVGDEPMLPDDARQLWVSSPAPDSGARLRKHELVRQVKRVVEAAALLDAPGLASVFGPGSLAEVEICAPVQELGGARILGRIDRLVVAAEEILAVDFKSNRAVPDAPESVPEGILRQMGAYRAALTALWPDRPVETAILWTRTGALMRLPAGLVAAAVARAADLDPALRRS